MNCPKCGKEMSLGWMTPGKSSLNLEWAPGHWHFPLPRKGKLTLKPPLPRESAFDTSEYPAHLCQACKTVIFEYE